MSNRLRLAISAGLNGQTTKGKVGDKNVYAYHIHGAGNTDGWYDSNTNQRIASFEPPDSAADKKPSVKVPYRMDSLGNKIATKVNEDGAVEDVLDKDGKSVIIGLPKAPPVGRRGGGGRGGGGKPVTPAQKIAMERGYQSDLDKAKLKAYEDTGKINPAWTAPQQQAEKDRIASQLSSATGDAHRKYQSTLASVGLEHYPVSEGAPPASGTAARPAAAAPPQAGAAKKVFPADKVAAYAKKAGITESEARQHLVSTNFVIQ